MVIALLTSRLAIGQEMEPTGLVIPHTRTDTRPALGVSITIPMHKLFGPGKKKTLPFLNKPQVPRISDLAIVSVADQSTIAVSLKSYSTPDRETFASLIDEKATPKDSLERITNDGDLEDLPPVYTITLPVVVVTAPAPGGGGGPSMTVGPYPDPAMVPPSVGTPGNPGGDNGVDETDADGNPMEKPCKGQLRRARQAYEDQIRVSGAVFFTAMAGCGITAAKLSGSVAVADAWLVLIPGLGEVALGTLVAGTGVVAGGLCVTTAALALKAAISSAASNLDMATLQIGSCP